MEGRKKYRRCGWSILDVEDSSQVSGPGSRVLEPAGQQRAGVKGLWGRRLIQGRSGDLGSPPEAGVCQVWRRTSSIAQSRKAVRVEGAESSLKLLVNMLGGRVGRKKR